MDGWLDGFERHDGEGLPGWSPGTVAPKIVLHTTEGGASIEAVVNVYRAHRGWPHFTVDPWRKRKAQHVPLDRPARALKNLRGGVETNRAPKVWQIEIIGFANGTHTWPESVLDWLGTEVIAPIAAATGTPLVSPLTFYGADAGWTLATRTARQRLSGGDWWSYAGIIGHQHVPENDHWDPGALDVRRILEAAKSDTPAPPPPPEEFTVDAEARQYFERLIDAATRTDRRLQALERDYLTRGKGVRQTILEIAQRTKDLASGKRPGPEEAP